MGTMEEKWAYLKKTKELIKAAIIGKGQAVADDATFRSYAASIENISTVDTATATELDTVNGEVQGDTPLAKAQYVAGTKDALKTALVAKGQTVADTDTFRSYAEKVNGMAVDSTPNQTLTMASPTASTTLNTGYTYPQLSVINLKGVTDIPASAFYDTSSTYKPWGKLTTVVGDSVKTIGGYAFQSCTSLASISLPAVTNIGDYAFNSCTSLASVSLPAVKTIGGYAFQSCTSLASISLPAVTNIGDYAFNSCTSLASVPLPAVTTIGTFAFQKCTLLASVSLPAVTTIGDYAFYSCTSLASVSIGSSITTIGHSTFYSCSALKTITINRKSGAVSGSPWGASATVSWTGTA